MSKFVQFFAKGIIYNQDENGRPYGVKKTIKGGVTFDNADLMDKVFIQCPNLLPYDWVEVETCPIG